MDIELDGKNMFFGRTLLYRTEYRTLTIINNTPVSFFWFLEFEESVNSQISFTPHEGMIDAHSRREVEFQYNANTVTPLPFQLSTLSSKALSGLSPPLAVVTTLLLRKK